MTNINGRDELNRWAEEKARELYPVVEYQEPSAESALRRRIAAALVEAHEAAIELSCKAICHWCAGHVPEVQQIPKLGVYGWFHPHKYRDESILCAASAIRAAMEEGKP